MRTIIWFIYFWLYLLFLWPWQLYARRLEKQGDFAARDTVVIRMVQNWARGLLTVAGVRVTVKGLEQIPDCPVVFVSNHQGNFDIPIMLAWLNRPHPMLAKSQLLKVPFIRSWMSLLECVFIDRKNTRQSVLALSQSAKLVKRGYSIVIFPEGTRSQCDTMGEFKYGAFRVATKAGAPIVPLRIDGSWRVMEGNHNFIRPAHVTLTVLPPVETAGLSKEEASQLHTLVEERISLVATVG